MFISWNGNKKYLKKCSLILNKKKQNKRLKQQRTSCETSNWKEFWFSHRRCSYLHTLPWNLSDKKGNKNFSRKISDKKKKHFSLSLNYFDWWMKIISNVVFCCQMRKWKMIFQIVFFFFSSFSFHFPYHTFSTNYAKGRRAFASSSEWQMDDEWWSSSSFWNVQDQLI